MKLSLRGYIACAMGSMSMIPETCGAYWLFTKPKKISFSSAPDA